jgi:hypothetical protein
VVKGLVSASLFMQDVPAAAQGGALTFGAVKLNGDKWFLGGDVRQSRLTFNIRGPEVLGGATPLGVVEMDLGGYNYQILAANGISSVADLASIDPMTGNLIHSNRPLAYNAITNEPRFDESLVPRIRLAYIELNWGNSQNILRVGQYHNLLLGMIAGSASHIATPLGYGAGQLGWRSPGITYIHRFPMSATSNLDFGVQINRNSWRDELPNCYQNYSPGIPGSPPPTSQAPAQNCLPYGISAGEASMLPQIEARIMAFGGMAEAPLPFYLPTKWQFYIVGHWDKKDLSGVGNNFDPSTIPLPGGAKYRDSMDTMVAQAGFKFQLGPVLVAANAWYGKNAGNVFGHIFQMQDLNRPDISGFGAWGQLGFGLTKTLSLWAFGGIDKPNEQDIINAFGVIGQVGRLQNVQIAAQLVYTEGPIQIGVEYIMIMTKNYYAAIPGTPIAAVAETYAVSQPSLVFNYNF